MGEGIQRIGSTEETQKSKAPLMAVVLIGGIAAFVGTIWYLGSKKG